MPLMKPEEAVPVLGVSKATITRCVQAGAPVHRRGAVGRHYLIDPDEFIPWMERQRYKKAKITDLNSYSEKARKFQQIALGK